MLILGLLLSTACAAPRAAEATTTARGILLSVESPSISKVERFTLRTDDGQLLDFVTAPTFNQNQAQGSTHVMTPGHMRQHMALADPVLVTYQEANGTLIALDATDVS